MTRFIKSLTEIALDYDALVFDQWGVLHNGTLAYEGAIEIVERLSAQSKRLAVLSNSGKRSAQNIDRISAMGFRSDCFESVMTSGEALWQDCKKGEIAHRNFYPIERSNGDAARWAEGLDIALVDFDRSDAILLMGLPDGTDKNSFKTLLEKAHHRGLTLYCSNPDLASPRADGLVMSPGALAQKYKDQGGQVIFYGKPYPAVFDATKSILGKTRILMVGDSLEHDIAGAQSAGWDSLLVLGGLLADRFAGKDLTRTLAALIKEKGCPPPDFAMLHLS